MKISLIHVPHEYSLGFRYFAGAFSFRLGTVGIMIDFKPYEAI